MMDPQMRWQQRPVRDDIVRRLQRGMVKDLDDGGRRFVPRKTLIEIVSGEQVDRFLNDISTSRGSRRLTSPSEAVRRIAPETEVCVSCKSAACTGGRSIFATLLLIGRAELVPDIFFQGASICDRILPLRDPASDHCSSCQACSEAWQIPGLDAKDVELFGHYQYQVLSKVIATFRCVDLGKEECRCHKMSLPWAELESLGTPHEAKDCTVYKAKIFEGSHQLVSAQSRRLEPFQSTSPLFLSSFGLTQSKC